MLKISVWKYVACDTDQPKPWLFKGFEGLIEIDFNVWSATIIKSLGTQFIACSPITVALATLSGTYLSSLGA